ncbi:potassium-transporting ATPase subunit KdpC [Sphingomonas sp.]|uniref:potassium-transporting ATPase subunit KdpC n=1 Tax=Sphingomonas sp. TaxID=28214 RepID=UPI003B000FB1
MLTETLRALRPAAVLLLGMTAVTGLAYPAAITAIAQVAMPGNANGSLIEDRGRVIGSRLIGQNFKTARYFHPRPSAAGTDGYDAGASGATNLAPGSQDLRDAIARRVRDARADGMTGSVPADLVTTSASGLDPDLSPQAALSQVARIARVRGMEVATLRALVAARIERPVLGIIGEPHVNVLLLNRQLDALSATTAR